MCLRVSVVVVDTAWVTTSVACGGDAPRCPTTTAPFTPGAHGRWCRSRRAVGSQAAVGAIVGRAGVQPTEAPREPQRDGRLRSPAPTCQHHQGDGQQDQRQEPGSRVWHVLPPSLLVAPTRLPVGTDPALGIIACIRGEYRYALGRASTRYTRPAVGFRWIAALAPSERVCYPSHADHVMAAYQGSWRRLEIQRDPTTERALADRGEPVRT
jgi:hypothetical protein